MKPPTSFIMTLAVVLSLGAGYWLSESTSAPVEETPNPTQTVTVTEAVTPESCLAALEASDTIIADIFPKVIEQVATLPDMIVRAATAGMNMDSDGLDAITADLNVFNEKISGYTDDLVESRDVYTSNRDNCRG